MNPLTWSGWLWSIVFSCVVTWAIFRLDVKAFERTLWSLMEGEMARATVLKTTQKFYLETLPGDGTEEGGWVELRRLAYGEKLDKDSDAMKMRFNTGDGKNSDMAAEVSMINTAVQIREFQLCIVDHNLEDDSGNKLDFTKPAHVRALDPRIGEEISNLIGDMNDFRKQAEEPERDAEGK